MEDSLYLNLETNVVIDQLPIVPIEKKDLFRKLFEKKVGDQLGHTNFTVRYISDEAKVIGAFIDCKSVAEADRAVGKLHGFRLSKADTFIANRWSDFDKAFAVSDEYQPPEHNDDDDEAADMTNPFLYDQQARPQLLIKAGDTYDVSWHWYNTQYHRLDTIKAPGNDRADVCRSWSEMDRRAKKLQAGFPAPLPMWSPNGTYLITQHPDSLRAWGGRSMQLLAEFPVTELQYLHISPSERFMVTHNGREFSFWNIAEGRLLRTIAGPVTSASQWPVYKYNADDSVVARVERRKEESLLMAYDAETMKLIVQELPPKFTMSLKEPFSMGSFSWSPTNPAVIAYVVNGDDQTGHRVQLERMALDKDDDHTFASFTSVSRRNFFQAVNIDLLWHPDGSMLAAKINKNKSGKVATEFCVFRVGASLASAEMFDPKGTPMRFAWQPSAPRFAVMLEATTTRKQTLAFYEAVKVGFEERGSFPTETERFFWAPKGTRCVAVNFEKSRLEFYGVPGSGPFTAPNQRMSMIAGGEHPFVTNVQWEPTGRFFCSVTSSLEQGTDNQYMIWSVNGQKVLEKKIQRLSHVIFRPLPRTILDDSELNAIKKNLPKKSEEFVKQQLAEQRTKDEATMKKKEQMEDTYIKKMDEIKQQQDKDGYAQERQRLIQASPAYKRQQALLKTLPMIKEMREVEEE